MRRSPRRMGPAMWPRCTPTSAPSPGSRWSTWSGVSWQQSRDAWRSSGRPSGMSSRHRRRQPSCCRPHATRSPPARWAPCGHPMPWSAPRSQRSTAATPATCSPSCPCAPAAARPPAVALEGLATARAPLPALTGPILPRAESIAAADQQAYAQLAAAARPAAAPLAAPSLLHHLAARPGLLSSLAAATTHRARREPRTSRRQRRSARRAPRRRPGTACHDRRRARAAPAARSLQRHDRPHDGAERPPHPRARER